MQVPEASPHFHHGAATRKDEVRPAGKIATMQPLAVAHCVSQSSHLHFWVDVLRPDCRHHSAAYLGNVGSFPTHRAASSCPPIRLIGTLAIRAIGQTEFIADGH